MFVCNECIKKKYVSKRWSEDTGQITDYTTGNNIKEHSGPTRSWDDDDGEHGENYNDNYVMQGESYMACKYVFDLSLPSTKHRFEFCILLERWRKVGVRGGGERG